MRNLVRFIWRHHIFFLFLLLEVAAFSIIVRNRNYHNSTLINSSNKATGKVLEGYSEFTGYFNLRETNEKLAYENAALRSILPSAYHILHDSTVLVSDTMYRQQYRYTVARVINNSTNRLNNYLTLDKGSRSGVKEGMGVIAPDGVVGVVRYVSKNYSSVMSLLNKEFQLSVRVLPSDQLGSVNWPGGHPGIAMLNDVARHATIEKGDTVITSQASGTFPAGIMVGVVDKVSLVEGDNFFTISILLSTDFGSLSHVYMIDNLLKEEQQALEAITQEEENDD